MLCGSPIRTSRARCFQISILIAIKMQLWSINMVVFCGRKYSVFSLPFIAWRDVVIYGFVAAFSGPAFAVEPSRARGALYAVYYAPQPVESGRALCRLVLCACMDSIMSAAASSSRPFLVRSLPAGPFIPPPGPTAMLRAYLMGCKHRLCNERKVKHRTAEWATDAPGPCDLQGTKVCWKL